MNVYKIGKLWIAAKQTTQALQEYMKHHNHNQKTPMYEMQEGDTLDITMNIQRLTVEEINDKQFECCLDGESCHFCDDQDDVILISLADHMTNNRRFPAVLFVEP